MQRKRKRPQPANTDALGAPTAQTPELAPDQSPVKPHSAKRQRLLPPGNGPVSSDSDEELCPAEDDKCPGGRGDDSSDCGLGNGDGCPDQGDEPWSDLEEQRLLAYRTEKKSWRWISAQFPNRAHGAILTRWRMLRNKQKLSDPLETTAGEINQSAKWTGARRHQSEHADGNARGVFGDAIAVYAYVIAAFSNLNLVRRRSTP
jgi:hypothetical protein